MTDARAWLDAYGRAWERRDDDDFVALFTPDALYHWTPFDEPNTGHDGIRAAFAAAVATQRDIRFQADLLAVTPDAAIAHWSCAFEREGTGTRVSIDGILQFELDGHGRCRRFREWWHSDEAL